MGKLRKYATCNKIFLEIERSFIKYKRSKYKMYYGKEHGKEKK
jgi:hypothetical protein